MHTLNPQPIFSWFAHQAICTQHLNYKSFGSRLVPASLRILNTCAFNRASVDLNEILLARMDDGIDDDRRRRSRESGNEKKKTVKRAEALIANESGRQHHGFQKNKSCFRKCTSAQNKKPGSCKKEIILQSNSTKLCVLRFVGTEKRGWHAISKLTGTVNKDFSIRTFKSAHNLLRTPCNIVNGAVRLYIAKDAVKPPNKAAKTCQRARVSSLKAKVRQQTVLDSYSKYWGAAKNGSLDDRFHTYSSSDYLSAWLTNLPPVSGSNACEQTGINAWIATKKSFSYPILSHSRRPPIYASIENVASQTSRVGPGSNFGKLLRCSLEIGRLSLPLDDGFMGNHRQEFKQGNKKINEQNEQDNFSSIRSEIDPSSSCYSDSKLRFFKSFEKKVSTDNIWRRKSRPD